MQTKFKFIPGKRYESEDCWDLIILENTGKTIVYQVFRWNRDESGFLSHRSEELEPPRRAKIRTGCYLGFTVEYAKVQTPNPDDKVWASDLVETPAVSAAIQHCDGE